ncbi:chemosensory receptor C [Biomphalaria pfeifferi]|uniref:Chemosensory receptor C n=1 Tax=Biomphalaria pfeifferi TaxID=112525 RepID=A0AAD8B689_BIOPF|nr:chemosensory receptor C [Biomphalaria pfeifferi]
MDSPVTSLRNESAVKPITSAAYPAVNNDIALLAVEYFSPVVSIILGSTGLVFNFLNTKVFLKQGVKDCVAICLLSLSLTDNGSLCCGLMAAGCRVFNAVTSSSRLKFFVDPMSVWRLLVQGQFCFYDLSTYTTAFIATERCLCVMMPLKFKSIFTLRRSFCVLFILYLSTCLFHVFFFTYSEFRIFYDPKLNISQIFLYYSPPHKLVLEQYLQVFNNLSLSCVALLIILITSVAMIYGLLKSEKFRNTSFTVTNTTKTAKRRLEDVRDDVAITAGSQLFSEVFNENNDNVCQSSQSKSNTENKGQTLRNMRVVKMVYILAFICFVCDSLRFAAMTLFYVDTDMRPGERKALAFNVISGMVFVVQIANCSVNILVYLTCNQSYRQTFLSLFRSKTNYYARGQHSHLETFKIVV